MCGAGAARALTRINPRGDAAVLAGSAGNSRVGSWIFRGVEQQRQRRRQQQQQQQQQQRRGGCAAPTASAPSSGSGTNRNSQSPARSEEHTSELQSLMRISYAVFCLKKKK